LARVYVHVDDVCVHRAPFAATGSSHPSAERATVSVTGGGDHAVVVTRRRRRCGGRAAPRPIRPAVSDGSPVRAATACRVARRSASTCRSSAGNETSGGPSAIFVHVAHTGAPAGTSLSPRPRDRQTDCICLRASLFLVPLVLRAYRREAERPASPSRARTVRPQGRLCSAHRWPARSGDARDRLQAWSRHVHRFWVCRMDACWSRV